MLGLEAREAARFCGAFPPPLALSSGGSPKENVDPFYYGESGAPPPTLPE